jgi:hypothetical protein
MTAEQGKKTIFWISLLKGGQLADVPIVVPKIDPYFSVTDRVIGCEGAWPGYPHKEGTDQTFMGKDEGYDGRTGATNFFKKIMTRRI